MSISRNLEAARDGFPDAQGDRHLQGEVEGYEGGHGLPPFFEGDEGGGGRFTPPPTMHVIPLPIDLSHGARGIGECANGSAWALKFLPKPLEESHVGHAATHFTVMPMSEASMSR